VHHDQPRDTSHTDSFMRLAFTTGGSVQPATDADPLNTVTEARKNLRSCHGRTRKCR